MKYILPTLLAIFLLFGCISQSYYQKIDRDGTSKVTLTSDFSKLPFYGSQIEKSEEDVNTLTEQALSEMCENAKKLDKTITCNIKDPKIIEMEKDFDVKDGYYVFEVNEGIPFNTYRAIIYKIPSDQFGRAVYPTAKGYLSYLSNTAFPQSPSAIDFRKKQENAITAAGLKDIIAFEYTYTVEMPGEVINAYAGETIAKVKGNTAEFNVVEVLQKSEPLVVESREFNIVWSGLIIGIIIMLGLAFSFFFMKEKSNL
ncbi:hypothetical protein HYT84_04160 [Candidatus Micrarchaeota archaeon]|nr:hypothetical protein [Candidatus Micrarchaeota archaeon]